MPNYSFHNVIVAKQQLPEATYIASFRRWNELGRTIRAGENAIRIFAPKFQKKREKIEVDGVEKEIETSRVAGFIAVPVFDISQTLKTENAVELPIDRIKLELEGESEEAKRISTMIHEICSIPIYYQSVQHANGYYDLVNDCIVIKESLSTNHQAKTLVHEYCHSVVHRFGGEDEKSTKEEKEVVAEGVAFIICSYFGLDTSDYSFGYIQSWTNDKGESLRLYGKKIFSISNRIISKMEKIRSANNGNEKRVS